MPSLTSLEMLVNWTNVNLKFFLFFTSDKLKSQSYQLLGDWAELTFYEFVIKKGNICSCFWHAAVAFPGDCSFIIQGLIVM